MSEFPDNPIPVLAFGKSFHGETIVIQSKDFVITPNLTDFCRYHGLNITRKNGSTILSSLTIETDCQGNDYIYAGKAFSENYGLVIGSNDIGRLGLNVNELKENCGEYHLVTLDDDGIQVRGDWFGYQPLFHYNANWGGAVSTSYHLMLLVLKVIGEELRVDIPHALEILKEKWTFTSALSVELENCRCNRTYEYFVISNAGITVRTTSAYEDLHLDGPYSASIYEQCIHQAKEDILGHVKMVFEHPAFDSVVVDLSGGLDTRLVYAACSVLPDSLIRPKIRISTRGSGTPNDMDCESSNYVAIYSLHWHKI